MSNRTLASVALAAFSLTPCLAFADDLSTQVSVRPINATYFIEPDSTSYSGNVTIDPASLHDPRYKLKSIAITDITIATKGPDLGTFSGTVKINGVNLFTYTGQWKAFETAQSLLKSQWLKKNQSGINALTDALIRGKPVVMSVSGIAEKAPTAKNANSITVYAPMHGSGLADN